MLHRRLLPTGLLAAAGFAAFAAAPAAAHAGVLVESGTDCAPQALSQPFLPWGDPSEYTLVPGGGFESGTPSWSLSGGATVVAGNESFDVGGGSDTQSLSLPAGSSATSVPMCVGLDDPDVRFFDRNTGDPEATLDVSVTFTTSLGTPVTIPIGVFAASAAWKPTTVDPIIANLLAFDGVTPVTFTFTPQGGDWQVDDVYVDPNGRGG